jgi:hypothetical protein
MTLSWVAIVVSTTAACTQQVAVPELDSQVIDTVGMAGRTSAEVLQRLGEPSVRRVNGTQPEWDYAIRTFQSGDALRRAGVLRIEFGHTGVVSDWYFLDPRSRARLPVRETLAAARRYLGRICKQPIREVNLEAGIRRGETTPSEIADLLEPLARYTRRREISTGSGLAWDYDVDRPSPVFIPPFYITVTFGDKFVGSQGLVTSAVPQGYGGCI